MKSVSTPASTKNTRNQGSTQFCINLTRKQADAINELARYLHVSPEDTILAALANVMLTDYDDSSTMRSYFLDALDAAKEDRISLSDCRSWCKEEDDEQCVTVGS